MIDAISLDHLDNGTSAQILDLRGRPEQIHRLEELGFRRGTTIQMLQSGSPCIIKVAGTKMCFRRCVNCNVLVTPPQTR